MAETAGRGTDAKGNQATRGKATSPRAGEDGTARASFFSPRNIGAVYVWVAMIVLFSIIASDSFPQTSTIKAVFNQYSVNGLAALAIVAPLTTGTFDLSIGANIGLSGVLAGYLLERTDLPGSGVITLVLLAGLTIGLLNAIVVVWLRVDSFIGTLATGSILAAVSLGLSGGNIFSAGVAESLSQYVTRPSILGFTLPVLYMLIMMLLLGFLLEQTATGRRMYATGFDTDVARLAGVKTDLMRTAALLVSGVVGSIAGIVLVSQIGAADPTQGNAYLLSAFAAAFVGATQFRHGRFNAWGTVVAVLMLGTGNIGLIMSGGPIWTSSMFNGVVLVAAMAFSYSSSEGSGVQGRIKSLRRRAR